MTDARATRLYTDKVAAARVAAAAAYPYLASALFACAVRWEPGCGTIAADREWRVVADPVCIGALDVDDLARLLVHHAAHLLRDHAARADSAGAVRDGRYGWWNRASDAEINDDLAVSAFVPRVAPDVPVDLGGEPGALAESYYEREPVGPRRWDCGSGADGAPRPWDGGRGTHAGPGPDDGQCPGLGAGDAGLVRLGVAAEIQRHDGLLPGTVPGGWRRWAESVLPSRTDWRRVLAAEIRRGVASVAGKVDYTYRRPSRRARTAPRVILPSLHRPVPDVVIVCDTSGSMHDGLLAQVLAEVDAILTRAGLGQTRVRVLAVDTNVHAVRAVTRASQVVLAGGGGTDMGAGIAAAARLRPRPSMVVVLTDGFTPWPARPPDGVRVVVGLLSDGATPIAPWTPPEWARTVTIDPSR